ncbi:alpha/beta family hydrolase [Poseidonocella sp. HB161398]|uniref:alpha/beta family hydrolase n=1 Tax=Poseidonocella sp. HB161398 TaxID=2320855 RepID=UPI001109FDF2|nr:alpha/beta family hydrolase [Poseidonocella sp. HB161398]
MEFLFDGDGPDRPTVLLAHGAGAPMDSSFMTDMAAALAGHGLRVARFEFAYMAQRRSGGGKRPPPKVEALEQEFRAAIAALACPGPLFIGGKSMGGRVASLAADRLHAEGAIAGLLCLGYPFHPAGKPERLRTAHLESLSAPALICQGSRDAFGSREEVAAYALSPQISVAWLEDGNHDFAPRKRVTGRSQAELIAEAAAAAAAWIASVT